MYMNIYICVYVYIYTHTHHLYTYIYTYICLCITTDTYIYIRSLHAHIIYACAYTKLGNAPVRTSFNFGPFEETQFTCDLWFRVHKGVKV